MISQDLAAPLHFRCALVTGASSGLGLEFAKQLTSYCDTLVLVARRGDRLDAASAALKAEASALKVEVITADLASRQGRQTLLQELSARQLSPDLLVNNAGMGDYGEFLTSDWAKTETMIRLNMEALTHLTHVLLPDITGQQGAIINVSSLASTLPIPDFAVYAATKAYVSSFSEALRIELKEKDVSVLAVCPGPVKTEFGKVAMRTSASSLPVQGAFYVTKEQVVSDSLSALKKNRARVYPGFKVAAAAALIGSLPFFMVRGLMSLRARRSS